MNLSKELTNRISDHLSKVSTKLDRLSPDERMETVKSIESHIHAVLKAKTDSDQTMEALEEILSQMKSPEEYMNKRQIFPKGYKLLFLVVLCAGMIAFGLTRHISRPAGVVGAWESIDFVKTIDDFYPSKKVWARDLFLKGVIFYPDGTTDKAWWTWTDNSLYHDGDKTTAMLEIKKIKGIEYLFIEWKSGDAIDRYFVLIRANSN